MFSDSDDQDQEGIIDEAIQAVLSRAVLGDVGKDPVVWAAVSAIYQFVDMQEQVSNREVPKKILLSLSHLTSFLTERSDDKNVEEKEMRDVDTVSRFTEERRKSLVILKSPFTTTTTTSSPPDDLFSKDDFEYEDEGLDYYQYDPFETAD